MKPPGLAASIRDDFRISDDSSDDEA